ncbi:PPOX class F420-dependent oxidoreductase [Jatrophihabitans endophyticus]|uniref:PPOX class F420-dependent oxidoreductase n=1 Tax=Jatrophihabitans endophyticus TaxID=1206085 RepID=UPI0019DF8282|nr:PPOX class F420-dependent oxidoreductase [Jatrophihabitans endophyticus]MBE7188507.1 PPOX class F420-dependent oxidoreductase [Jatrophihabitans endophyticus]
MDADEAREFLTTHHRGVLATFRKDGRPAMSPVAAAVDAEGRVVVSTRETAMKIAHLRRDPRVAFTGFTDGFYGPWVQVEGTAEIVGLPDAMELLVEYYRSVAGEHDDWDDYRAAMTREQRVVVRFAIERAGPNVSG